MTWQASSRCGASLGRLSGSCRRLNGCALPSPCPCAAVLLALVIVWHLPFSPIWVCSLVWDCTAVSMHGTENTIQKKSVSVLYGCHAVWILVVGRPCRKHCLADCSPRCAVAPVLSDRSVRRYLYSTQLSGTLPESVGEMKAMQLLCEIAPLAARAPVCMLPCSLRSISELGSGAWGSRHGAMCSHA